MFSKSVASVAAFGVFSAVRAHIGGYHEGMFCMNGYSNDDQPNNNEVSNPMVNLGWDDFWFHGKCKDYPPAEGKSLELPAGGKAKLEHAGNRGQTSISFGGQYTGLWPDGADHPYDDSWNNTCITTPNLHTENRANAAGTVLAIAYTSNIHDVKYEDLVVVSVAPETPWHREVEYDIPENLPACDDCICAYSWIPNHCGIPNMYMNGFKCKVTGAKPDAPRVAKAQPAVWCEDDQSKCRSGAKGITIFNQQKDINTIDLSGIYQKDTQEASPGYNSKMGFSSGAQNDIFEASSGAPVNSAPAPTESSSAPVESAPASPTSSPISQPTEGCIVGTRTHSGHRKHQRRLFSLGSFSVSVDAE